MIRKSTAVWYGSGAEGDGILSTPSGVLSDTPYSFKARFVSKDGEETWTNPEELIAAAHAGCFSMALSFQLSGAGFPPDEIHTDALLTMEKEDAGWEIKGIKLVVEASVPNIDDAKFQELAGNAKAGCPVSKALGAIDITMDAKLR
ncbi:MAG: OsmC family protein [Ignavibacteria bacterium]|nr:OsmC family protein [Ignavibacteria bacterium]